MTAPSPPPRWLLRLHGEPVVQRADGPSALSLEPRAAALLALVALEPGIARQRVVTLLWPDSDDPRRNLRQQLLRFRRQFESDLLVGGDTLTLSEHATLERGERPLLGTFGYDDCEEFAAWLERQRRHERDGRIGAARARLAQAEAAGDWERALDAARELIDIDPREEAHHNESMRLHFLAGHVAAGLAVFERVERMLAAELGARPSAETLQLADALRKAQHGNGALPTLSAVRHALPITLKRPPVMAGRAAELALAQQGLAEHRVIWLEGEAGLGKSRFVAELLAAAHGVVRGAALAGAGRPGDNGAPYATLARLLRPWLATRTASLSAGAQAALAHIASGFEAAAEHVTMPALKPGALETAVAELLAQGGAPLVVLDDLHFADEATIELLGALAANAETAACWLFATRPAETTAAARRLRESLIELQRSSVIALEPLNADGVAALIEGLGIAGLQGRTLAEPLVRHTGGNPLFVLETMKQGLHDGSLLRGQLPRPSNVSTLIEVRLGRLSEAALALARVAAIAGVDFRIELAEAATGTRALQLASAWRELQDAQILRDEAFAHDLVSEAVLRGVPPVVARRVHAQCAQWLESRDAEPARVARHWLAGGEPGKAGRAFVAAAARASLAGRHQEEAVLYQQAAAACEAAGSVEDRFEALCNRVRALNWAQFGEPALIEARSLVHAAATGKNRLRAQLELAGMLTERGQAEEAVEVGRELMTLARQCDDDETAARGACHLSTALCRLGRAGEALAVLMPLRSWVESQPQDELRMLWHGDWAAVLGNLGRLREAVMSFDVARAAARRKGDPASEGRLMLNCAVTLRQCGQFDRALALAKEGQVLAAGDAGDATHEAIARLVIAREECETGRYASALSALEKVLPQFEAAAVGFWSQAARMVLATLWLRLGQAVRAIPLLEEDAPDVPPWLRADRQLLCMELAKALQRREPAGALQRSLKLSYLDPQRGPGLRVRAMRHQAPTAVLDQARALATELAANERFGVLMSLQVHVARAALAEGRVDEAAQAAEQLIVRFDEGYAPDAVYRAEAWWIASRALDAANRAAEADQVLKRGVQWVTEQALPHVPAPFIDSFLHRNPVNRELLARAAAT